MRGDNIDYIVYNTLLIPFIGILFKSRSAETHIVTHSYRKKKLKHLLQILMRESSLYLKSMT